MEQMCPFKQKLCGKGQLPEQCVFWEETRKFCVLLEMAKTYLGLKK